MGDGAAACIVGRARRLKLTACLRGQLQGVLSMMTWLATPAKHGNPTPRGDDMPAFCSTATDTGDQE